MGMRDTESTWQFASGFDSRRRAALESVQNFGQVVEWILETAAVLTYRVCRGKVGFLKQCSRPEFLVRVPEDTIDLFFNSPAGYRAQYVSDPECGQRQNALLIAAISDQLLTFAEAHPAKHPLGIDSLRLSLAACSAKVWLPESSISFDHNLVEEIVVPRWHRNALTAIEAFCRRERPTPEQQEKAIWGIRALRAGAIEVKGAFLSAEEEEVVPRDKIRRRFDIHEFGFA
jgi:hypothetical protein